MSTMPTTRRAAVAVAIAGLTASLLTGCFGNPGDLVNQGVEDAIEGATGGDVSLDGELPDGLPRRRSRSSTARSRFAPGAGGAEGWVVVITSSAADPVADAAAALEGAGFTEDTARCRAARWARAPTRMPSTPCSSPATGTTVTYTVTPKQQ